MQSASNKKTILTWYDIQTAIGNLHYALTESGYNYQPKTIVGICRGGMIPAVMLSHRFGVRDVRSVTAVSYGDDERQNNVELLDSLTGSELAKPIVETLNDPSVLIVDDLWDTGNTMKALRDTFPNATLVTLFHKIHEGQDMSSLNHAGTWQPNNWLHFPWETH